MFRLHERIAADTYELARWPLSLVLLMRDRTYPWLILVPALPDLRDIDDLSPADRPRLIEEIALASRLLKQAVGAEKMNVAALGNVVPQLHVHVIARFAADPAWPKPVWGVKPAEDYDGAGLAAMRAKLAPLSTAFPA